MAGSLLMVSPGPAGTKREQSQISFISTRVRHFSTEGTDAAFVK